MNSKTIYKLGLKQSQVYTLPYNIEISHLEFLKDNVFVVAARGQGIKFL